MSPSAGYRCCECQEWHPRQAFISHAGKDEAIAKEAARVCCAAQVKPYRFEDSAEFSMPAIDNARTIAEEIINSDIFLVVLSPSVSEAFWTQAWIGFEIGVSIGVAIASKGPSNYFTGRIVVLQDIQQDIEVSVPRVDDLFLFDFGQPWNDIQALIEFISVYMSRPDGEVYRRGNSLRERMMTGRVACANEKCKGSYEVVMPVKDTELLESKVWCNDIRFRRLQWIAKGLRAESILKCPSCGKRVSCELTRPPSLGDFIDDDGAS